MPGTYEPITTQTLSSGVTNVTLSSIPSTYTDLVLVIQGRTSTQQLVDCSWQVNGDTGSNYSHIRWGADSGGTWTDRASNQTSANASGIGYGQTALIWQFQNYSNTTTYKTALMRSNFQTNSIGMYQINGIGLWRSTSAINQIKFFIPAGQSGDFVSGMMITLYGIKAA
jgi:hypothetical protein